jgi:hypothetical protein
MMELESVPWYTVVLPVALVVGSWAVSKLLRFSFLATLLVSTLPLGVPFMELPLSEDFTGLRPEVLIGGGWLVLLAFAVGWVAVRPVVISGAKSFGMLKMVYVVVLGAALLVVALLVSRPELMNTYAPGWKGGAGVVLLCASLLSMSFALARIFRAAFMFSLWALVSLVLASEIFLDKLPQEIVREDLRHIESLVPSRIIDSAIEQLNVTVPEGATKLKAFVLGGSTSTGFPFSGERGLAGRLQQSLSGEGVDVQVQDASIAGASIYDIRKIAREKLLPAKPDLVVLVGWAPDSEVGVNSYGLRGLTEREAIEHVQHVSQVREIPLAESVLTSTLYRFIRGQELSKPARGEPLPRVPVDEYRTELRETVRELRAAGAKVVLVSEPTVEEGGLGYREAMQQVASSESALFIPVSEDLAKRGDPLLFGRGKILSDKGYSAVADSMSRYLRSFVGADVVPQTQDVELAPSSTHSAFGAQGHEVKMVVRPSDVSGDIVFRVRMLEQGTRFYRVVFSANGQFVGDKRLDSRESVHVRFQLPQQYRSLPIVELGLHTVASPPLESDRIGSSQVYVPVPLSISMERDRETAIKVGRDALYSAEPFSAVAVDPRSGDILTSVRASNPLDLSVWSRTLPWGTMVVGALSTPQDIDASTVAPLKSISGGLALPAAGERSAFVGLVGGAKGDLLMESGRNPLSLSIGSAIVSAYNRFILEEVAVNDKPLQRLDV